MKVSARSRALHLRLSTKDYWPEGLRTSNFLTLTKTHVLQPSIQPVPPATRKESFSHRQLVLHTLATLGSLASTPEHQRFHRGDVYMPVTPMFHVHAWGVPYVATAMGIKQVYPGRYLPDMLLTLIQREQVTFSHCVPTLLHMMLSSPASQNIDLSGWKVIIGGSTLPKGLAKLAMDKGNDIFGGFGFVGNWPIVLIGQTETT